MEENESAPPGEKLSEADLLIDPEYEEMLDKQGRELCEEVKTDENTRPVALHSDQRTGVCCSCLWHTLFLRTHKTGVKESRFLRLFGPTPACYNLRFVACRCDL